MMVDLAGQLNMLLLLLLLLPPPLVLVTGVTLWKLLPDLAGPTMSHCQSGRPAPRYRNRSSLKY